MQKQPGPGNGGQNQKGSVLFQRSLGLVAEYILLSNKQDFPSVLHRKSDPAPGQASELLLEQIFSLCRQELC